MQSTASTLPARSPNPAPDLSTAPLPQVLAALGAEVVDSSITDPGFFGALTQRGDGRLVLSLPPGRDTAEREAVARALLGDVLGLPLSPLPRTLRQFTVTTG